MGDRVRQGLTLMKKNRTAGEREMRRKVTKKKEQGRWLSTKENGHKKTGTTGYNRARHIGEVVFEVVRCRQVLVSAGDPCNAPGSKSCLPLFCF